jgi:hypothetical protein
MSLNAEWHRAHPMPKRPTDEQRLEWHRGHVRNCGCRKPPPKLAAILEADEQYRTARAEREAHGFPTA